MPHPTRRLTLALTAGLAVAACRPDAPAAGRGAGAAASYGSPDSVPVWTAAQKAAGFPHMERVFPTRRVAASPTPSPLPDHPVDLSDVRFEAEGEVVDLETFAERFHVAGLIVLVDGRVALETYRLGHTAEERWTSFSVAKSVVSMLVGAAIRDGLIGSVDDPVTRYLPDLVGSSYEGVRIEDLLHMASGVSWNEDYLDLSSDVNATFRLTLDQQIAYMGALPRVAPPDTRFNYNTGETDLVGALVRSAVGTTLSAYLERKIWRPAGMEADALWMLYDQDAGEYGGSGLNAVLRDYARVGLLALHDGVLPDGTRVLPEGWMAGSTKPSDANPGYGRFWWLQADGAYAARGIFGQMIWIDPSADVVIAVQSAWDEPTGHGEVYSAMAQALTEAVAATAPAH